MRITHFFAKGPGPLNSQSGGLYDLDLTDGGFPAEHILLSGPSGSGKTTLLLAMAQLWQGLGGLMRGKPPMGLMRSDCAMVVEDLADNPLTLFLMDAGSGWAPAGGYAPWSQTMAQRYPFGYRYPTLPGQG